MSETYIFGNVGGGSAQIGTNTMLNTSGAGNSGFGNNVFTNLTTGTNNSGFGVEVASGLSFNGSNNTAFGVEVMKDATIASDISAFGYQALTAIISGNNNTAFGSGTGGTNTTGSNNIIMGANADTASAVITNSIAIGSDSIGGNNAISIGRMAQCLNTTASDNITIGAITTLGVNATDSIIIGNTSGNTGIITNTIGIGHQILSGQAPALCDKCVFMGWSAGGAVTEAEEVTALGENAALYMNGIRVTAIGYESLSSASTLGAYMTDNTGVGYFTGESNAGTHNTMIGFSAAGRTDVDSSITCTGGNSMEQITGSGAGSITTTANTQINANVDFTTSSDFNLITITNTFYGASLNLLNIGTAVGAGKLRNVFLVRAGSASLQEKFGFDATGAVATNLDGTYFLVSSTATDYYVWFNLDGGSVDPMVAGRTGIPVAIATGNPSTTIASNIQNAIQNVGGAKTIFYYLTTSAGDFFRITNNTVGNVTDIGAGTAVGPGKLAGVAKIADGTGGSGEISFVDFDGVTPIGLAGTYFLLDTPGTNYYVWFNSGSDTDPTIGGRTGIQVAYSAANYNTVLGWSALRGNVLGVNVQNMKENTIMGYNAAVELNTGSDYNTILGSNSHINNVVVSSTTAIGASIAASTSSQNTLLGQGIAVVSANRATSIGSESSATTNDTFALGRNTSSTVANTYQIGANSVSGSASMNFRTQVVADEAWIGGGSSSVLIDNNGNFVRGDESILEIMTTDASNTTMETYIMADNTTRQIETLVAGTRTGGLSGAPAQTYSVRLDVSVKRTGASLNINKVTEIHLQDPVTSLTILNAVAGAALDISSGNAVGGANELYTAATVVNGVNAGSEVTLLDFTGAFYYGIYGKYFELSSTTVDYYVWWNAGFSTDPGLSVPGLAGKTGIQVNYVYGSDTITVIAGKTATAINAEGGAGVVFTVTQPATTVRITNTGSMVNVPDIDGATAVQSGGLPGVAVTSQGGISNEKSVIDCTGTTKAGLDGTYFLLWGGAGTLYYFWFDGTGATADPSTTDPKLYSIASKTSVKVDISATASDINIATVLTGVITGLANFTAVVNTDLVRIVNTVSGSATDASSGTAINPGYALNYVLTLIDGANSAIAEESTVDAYGATPAGLQSKYFLISSTTVDYYIWYNTDGGGTDPTVPNATGIQVPIVTGDSAVSISTKTAAAINGVAAFSSSVQSAWSIDVVTSGTDAILQVSGSVGNDITWKAFTRNFAV